MRHVSLSSTFRRFVTASVIAGIAIVFVGCEGFDPRDVKINMNKGDTSSQPEPDTNAPDTDQDDDPSDGSCREATDCDDGVKGTIDTCVDGICVHKSVSCNNGFVLNEVGECVEVQVACPTVDDGDPCTIDSCDPTSGEAMHVAKACNDNNDLTADSCDSATGDCRHVFDCGNCSDEDPCTIESCDPNLGCQHEQMECPQGYACTADGGCALHCTDDSDCADNNWCTLDACNEKFGACENKPRNCTDGDDTTIDVCIMSAEPNKGECQNVPTDCTEGCDDGDICTDDYCDAGGKCQHDAQNCGVDTACSPVTGKCELSLGCLSDAKCDDGNECTEDECENGSCTHIDLDLCEDDELCDSVTGECFKLDQCPEGCDDGDKCTADVCLNGKCQFKGGEAVCGEGTAFNPDSCQCEVFVEDPECIDGTKACLQMGGPGTISWAICAFGKYWQINNCGSVAFNTCAPLTGCQSLQQNGPPNQCVPSCNGKSCGDNGCGGSCGSCGAGTTCNATGQCVVANAVDLFKFIWVKPSNGIPANAMKMVPAVNCKKGNTDLVNWHYLPTDPLSVVVPISAASAAFEQVVQGLSGSTCKANVAFYDVNNVLVGWAVADMPIVKLGQGSASYNGYNNPDIGVGSNQQGGGDFQWTIP